jgi:hypothetical protein
VASTAVRRLILQSIGVALDVLAVACEDQWALKGSTALSLFASTEFRIPRDVDLTFDRPLGDFLDALECLGGSSSRRVTVVRHQQIRFSHPEYADVYRVLLGVHCDEGEWDRLVLGVAVTHKQREGPEARQLTAVPTEYCARTIQVPTLDLETLLAQKVLRYTRQRATGRINTHWQDLFDLLVAAMGTKSAISLAKFRSALTVESRRFGRDIPRQIPAVPREWLDVWDASVFESGRAFGRLDNAVAMVEQFLAPVVATSTDHGYWDPQSWSWRSKA